MSDPAVAIIKAELPERFGRVTLRTQTLFRTPDSKEHLTLHAAYAHLREGLLAELFGRAGCADYTRIAKAVNELNREDKDLLVELLTKDGEEL